MESVRSGLQRRLPGCGHRHCPGVLLFAFWYGGIQRLQSAVALLILAQAERDIRRASDQLPSFQPVGVDMYLYCESGIFTAQFALVSGGRVTFAASTFSASVGRR
ncbi:hypothetical protein MJ561_08425 [Klebsiella pneumoniae]|nr:hypothetical protein MJ561_08425 [Klebsiella pneumoniae]